MNTIIILVDSSENNECPLKIQNEGIQVKANSGYCRSLCEHRNYELGEVGSDLIYCEVEE